MAAYALTISIWLVPPPDLPRRITAVEVGPVPVVKVIDGDIIVVTLEGKEEQVRQLCVDTPERTDNLILFCIVDLNLKLWHK